MARGKGWRMATAGRGAEGGERERERDREREKRLSLTCQAGTGGRYNYGCTHQQPWRSRVCGGHHHAPAALPPGKRPSSRCTEALKHKTYLIVFVLVTSRVCFQAVLVFNHIGPFIAQFALDLSRVPRKPFYRFSWYDVKTLP